VGGDTDGTVLTDTFASRKKRKLAVSPYAQDTHSGEFLQFGGEVWCSPTSTVTVMGYLGASVGIPVIVSLSWRGHAQLVNRPPFLEIFAAPLNQSASSRIRPVTAPAGPVPRTLTA
jgi:hypothetical protein